MAPIEIGVATDEEGVSHRVWVVMSQHISRCQSRGGALRSFKDKVEPRGVVTCLACLGMTDED